ncbi:MAG: GtrA family protein [Candidatus Doudnabacteria bacterium]|nr:GtrA family protein [Candidatus Doudnabacteria bacterium]
MANLADQTMELVRRRPVILQFLRFACIGLLNTALDFLVLNTISKALGITQGLPLGAINFISFTMAVIQSYLWNRTWTFGGEVARLRTNFYRLVLVGTLGATFVIFVILGSKFQEPWYFFLGLLAIYLFIESILWRSFGFHLSDWNHESHSFMIFFVITFIGLVINVTLVSTVSVHFHLTGNPDLDKNVAKIIATAVSLFWNFTGYKLVVFKK